jgi:hypothetical protein
MREFMLDMPQQAVGQATNQPYTELFPAQKNLACGFGGQGVAS